MYTEDGKHRSITKVMHEISCSKKASYRDCLYFVIISKFKILKWRVFSSSFKHFLISGLWHNTPIVFIKITQCWKRELLAVFDKPLYNIYIQSTFDERAQFFIYMRKLFYKQCARSCLYFRQTLEFIPYVAQFLKYFVILFFLLRGKKMCNHFYYFQS